MLRLAKRRIFLHSYRCNGLATLANADGAFQIPVIDFAEYRNAANTSQKRRTADAIVNAFKEVGFVYISGHGIPEAKIKNVFAKVSAYIYSPVIVLAHS